MPCTAKKLSLIMEILLRAPIEMKQNEADLLIQASSE
jgi:hypothetical protein